ncbi:hypothetical protein BSKO_00832 [Bryopsis sp. KO-2023]|nr:hypothetical protein BSKO_00832 [Bryopsis sp. KO-2023]
MGTGRKRKNAGVGIDFKKAKHKVGKKLKKAQNETDTTIKSQAIHMPDQSLANDKEGKAVTSRNLTLKDLVTQLGHYNAKVRRDALTGMGELFSAHPEELTQHAAMIIESIGEMAVDLDGAVRAQLLKLLSTQVFPNLTGGSLQPFVPLLMAHVCSSMTHAAMEVRSDALKFLNELMNHEPGLITAEFLLDCLEHFADMCGSLGRSRSLESLSQATMLKVLNAVTSFLTRVCETWSTPGSSPDGLINSDSPTSVLMSNRCDFAFADIRRFQAAISQSERKKVRDAPTAFERLFSRLLSLLSAGCTGLSEGGGVLADSVLAIQLTSAAMESIFHLFMLADIQHTKGVDCPFPLSPASIKKMSKVLASQVCTHFPMTLPDREVELNVRMLVSAFNCGTSRLLLRVLENADQGVSQPLILGPLVKFYMSALTVKEDKSAAVEAGRSELNMVLPDMFKIIPLLDDKMRHALLEAAGNLCIETDRDSHTKLQVLKLLHDVVQESFKLHGSTIADLDDELVISWLKMIPRIMWAAGIKNPEITKVCLSIVQHLSRTGNASILQQLGKMNKEFTLMFVIAKESKNKKVKASPGPLHKLPIDLQLLAVDILYYQPSLGDIILKTCLAVCMMKCYPIETCQRLLYAVSHAASSQRVSEKALNSLLVGLVTGNSEWDVGQQKCDSRDWGRSMLLCSGACELICSTGDENGVEIAKSIDGMLREGLVLDGRLKTAEEVRHLIGVLSFVNFVTRLGGPPGNELPTHLPSLVMSYLLAVAEDVAGVFSEKGALGDELAIDLIASCTGVLRKVFCLIEEKVMELQKRGLSSDTVQGLDHLCQVLLVLMNSPNRKDVMEGGPQIRGMMVGLNKMSEDSRLGTEVEGKFRDKVGKLGALCEHLFAFG